MEISFSIPVEIKADNISSFFDITEQINKLELNRRAFEKAVYLLDDKKTAEIAGEKHSRDQKGSWVFLPNAAKSPIGFLFSK